MFSIWIKCLSLLMQTHFLAFLLYYIYIILYYILLKYVVFKIFLRFWSTQVQVAGFGRNSLKVEFSAETLTKIKIYFNMLQL